MRDIKFRVWFKPPNNMKYANTMLYSSNDDLSLFWENGKLVLAFPKMFGGALIDEKYYDIMQWTSLKDKNDKDIYEGDIVLLNKKDMLKTIVKFESGKFIMSYKTQDYDSYYTFGDDNSVREVIGNIYENK